MVSPYIFPHFPSFWHWPQTLWRHSELRATGAAAMDPLARPSAEMQRAAEVEYRGAVGAAMALPWDPWEATIGIELTKLGKVRHSFVNKKMGYDKL